MVEIVEKGQFSVIGKLGLLAKVQVGYRHYGKKLTITLLKSEASQNLMQKETSLEYGAR